MVIGRTFWNSMHVEFEVISTREAEQSPREISSRSVYRSECARSAVDDNSWTSIEAKLYF